MLGMRTANDPTQRCVQTRAYPERTRKDGVLRGNLNVRELTLTRKYKTTNVGMEGRKRQLEVANLSPGRSAALKVERVRLLRKP